MEVKNCNHKSFWQIYKVINFNRTFNQNEWIEFKCSKCNDTCILKWKWYNEMRKNLMKRILTYFLWLLPAIILILLVANWSLNFLVAILLITIFHFAAMLYIINSYRLEIVKK